MSDGKQERTLGDSRSSKRAFSCFLQSASKAHLFPGIINLAVSPKAPVEADPET